MEVKRQEVNGSEWRRREERLRAWQQNSSNTNTNRLVKMLVHVDCADCVATVHVSPPGYPTAMHIHHSTCTL